MGGWIASGTHLSLVHLGTRYQELQMIGIRLHKKQATVHVHDPHYGGPQNSYVNFKELLKSRDANIDPTALTLDPALVKYSSELNQYFSRRDS